ncbi:unnamed protein product [Trifolium pratense]|uniref:Uncharacterized protein n=1 Tax=Trifolium pratense TaxID=57577 RepID=A0ACB0K833_TRIPR|nr:unnamed protein product [Trifolium pratense]
MLHPPKTATQLTTTHQRNRRLIQTLTHSHCFHFFAPTHLEMSRHPEVLWVQRSDKVYLTVSVPDAKDVSVKCEPHGLFTFSASKIQHESYNFSLELYGSIAPEGMKRPFKPMKDLNMDKVKRRVP